MNVLITYFSRKGSSLVQKEMIELAVGNTDVAAHILKKILGDELLQIEREYSYNETYHTCIKEAVQHMHE